MRVSLGELGGGLAIRYIYSAGPPMIIANDLYTGKYVTSGTRKNKVITFSETTLFTRGDVVVFRVQIIDQNSQALTGATATISIAGPQDLVLVLNTGPSNIEGIAEATWQTLAPNKRGIGGSATGSYTARITSATASGYIWNSVQTAAAGFSIQ